MAVADLTAHRLRAVLATAQREGRLPSVVGAVVRDGAVVWHGSAGGATGRPDHPPEALQYRVGSLTKTMTAVLVLQLRDEGRVALADPVSAYLPEVGWPVTLRALLAHGAGIAAEPPGEWWERVEGGPFDELAARLRGTAAPFEPGATHHYSNVGFALLGEVVARVSGRPWAQQLSERLLEPLGMRRTTFHPTAPHAQGFSVAPYTPLLAEEPAADTGAMAPAGQVWSTVGDLATYAELLLGGHPGVLPAATLEEMSTPQSGTAADGLSTGYGLGLRLLAGGSGTLVGHTGSMPGFQASLFVDRDRRAGAVVLANSTTGLATDAVAPRLLEVLEECEPTLARPWAPVSSVPAHVAEVVGPWFWGNTPFVLRWDGTLLELVAGHTGESQGAFTEAEGRFVGHHGYHQGEPLEVARRPDGSVGHLVCSTFVLTRTPYDPGAPIPGGVPGR